MLAAQRHATAYGECLLATMLLRLDTLDRIPSPLASPTSSSQDLLSLNPRSQDFAALGFLSIL